MNIIINENSSIDETQITINCRQANDQVLKIIATLRAFDKKLTGMKNGETHIIDAANVLYIDTVDKKTFIYTLNDFYETPLRLYEIEERLIASDFFRASKSVIVNLNQIKKLKPDLGGRLEVTLVSSEKLYISRQYVVNIKQKLGL